MTTFILFYWVMSIATMYFVYRITSHGECIDALGALILLGILWPVVAILLAGAIIVKGPKRVWDNIRNAWVVTLLLCLLMPMGLKADVYPSDMQPIQSSLDRINTTLNRMSVPPKDEHKGMKKITRYKLIASQSQDVVSENVNGFLADGWELFGGPCGDGKGYFGQAIIKITWVKQK